MIYNERGNILEQHDPLGNVTRYEYDDLQNPDKETAVIDPRGFRTERGYDGNGNLTQIIDPFGHTTAIAFNPQNAPTSITDVLGRTTQFTYSSDGLLTGVINAVGAQATFVRDAEGRVTSVTDFNGHTTLYNYDSGCPCGKPDRITHPDGTFRSYEYDAYGQTTRETDELGRTTVYEYDSVGRLLSVTDAHGHSTTHTYAGPLKITETDPLGRTTQYAYDSLNRTIAITNPEGGIARFEYDAAGNRTAVIDPLGNVTRFVYDAANRLVQQVDPEGQTTSYSYDAAGNRIEIVDRNGRRRTFEYDALNRRTQEQWWEGLNVVRTLAYAFNARGVMTSASDPASHLAFGFDALYRLTQAQQTGVAGLADYTLTYDYDGLANVVSVTDNSGVQVTSEYDLRDRLSRRVWQGGGLPGASAVFTYDAVGTRTKTRRFADVASTQFVGESTYDYNALGAVAGILHADGTGATLSEYDYARDAAQQITQRLLNGETVDYGYDLTGQLLTAAYSSGQPNETYQYDANGNRTGGSYTVGPNNQILADGTFNYDYDQEGNLISRSNISSGATTTYSYDHRNRLVSTVDRNGVGAITQTVEFVYDAIDRRIRKTVNGGATHFLYNQENIWADTDGAGAITARYLLGSRIDEMLARYWAARGIDWYLTDNLGTVRDIADQQGLAVAHIDYDSYGNVLNVINAAVVDRFLFTGREFDAETGFYFYRARYYSPQLGRFISQDPSGFDANDFNLYRYVKNIPVSLTDPTGMLSLIEYATKVVNVLKVLIPTKRVAAAIRCGLEVVACVLAAVLAFQNNAPGIAWSIIAICFARAALCPFTL